MVLFLLLWFFDVDQAVEETLGFTSRRMVAVEKGGRFAPFPKGISKLHIEFHQGMFHESYRGSFNAPAEITEAWLKNSPGVNEGSKKEVWNGRDSSDNVYDLKVSGNLQGELTVSGDHRHVSFYLISGGLH